jgi:hypothetical protein
VVLTKLCVQNVVISWLGDVPVWDMPSISAHLPASSFLPVCQLARALCRVTEIHEQDNH